jgi:hypothetical protein
MPKVDKNTFPDDIYLKDLGIHKGTRKYELMEDFRIFCDDKNLLITVPKGFITDGVSSPKFAWPIVGPMGSAFPAALGHDWCFSPFNNKFNWKESNWLFLQLMQKCGVGFFKRRLIYFAVVAGSYPIWLNRFNNYGI